MTFEQFMASINDAPPGVSVTDMAKVFWGQAGEDDRKRLIKLLAPDGNRSLAPALSFLRAVGEPVNNNYLSIGGVYFSITTDSSRL